LAPVWVFWVELAVVVLESAAFLGIGYALCKRHPRAQYVAVAVGTICLGYRILSSTFPHWFYLRLPYLVLTGVITPAGFLLLAAALTLRLRRSRQRILIGVFSVVLAYYVFGDPVYLVARGAAISRLAGEWQGETMRQSTAFTCGPAAAASLLDAWGYRVTEGEVAFAARTSYRGTELPRLLDAVRFFGRYAPLTVELRLTTLDGLADIDRPAVLFVKVGRMHHAITLLRLCDGEVVVADPGRGTCRYDLERFREEYAWGGRAIVAWRNSEYPRPPGEPPDPSLQQ